mgnify:CR=1 FL=1
MTIKGIKNKIKGVFKQPVKKYYIGKIKYYTPYFEPWNFNRNMISVRKLIPLSKEKLEENKKRGYGWAKEKYQNLPMVRRNLNWTVNIFGNDYFISVGKPFAIYKGYLGWKDKYESPRFEWEATFQIWFFRWQFVIHWTAPTKNKDLYWEMVLCYLFYADEDLEKARDSWGWVDETKTSTWDDNLIIEK